MLLALLVAIATCASADFAGDAHAAISSASHLNSVAAGWTRDRGLAGAVGIQRAYYPLSSAIKQLESSAPSFAVSQPNAEALGELNAIVSTLLQTFVDKATDLKGIGATTIVQSDINGLVHPVENIVSGVYAAGKHDCKFVEGLVAPVKAIHGGFLGCKDAYGADVPNFPELKC